MGMGPHRRSNQKLSAGIDFNATTKRLKCSLIGDFKVTNILNLITKEINTYGVRAQWQKYIDDSTSDCKLTTALY